MLSIPLNITSVFFDIHGFVILVIALTWFIIKSGHFPMTPAAGSAILRWLFLVVLQMGHIDLHLHAH